MESLYGIYSNDSSFVKIMRLQDDQCKREVGQRQLWLRSHCCLVSPRANALALNNRLICMQINALLHKVLDCSLVTCSVNTSIQHRPHDYSTPLPFNAFCQISKYDTIISHLTFPTQTFLPLGTRTSPPSWQCPSPGASSSSFSW